MRAPGVPGMVTTGASVNPSEMALDGAEPDLMVTDPPYGVNYDATWRYKAGVSTKDGAFGKSANDDQNDWQAAYALFPGSNCLESQVISQGLQAVLVRSMALRIVSNFRMHAMSATFFGLPAATKRR